MKTYRVFACLLAGYALLVLPGFIWPAYFDSPAGLLVIVPGMSVYLFHTLGVPGLLQHKGLCGWGPCPPTAFGWVFVVVSWLLLAWLVSWALAKLWARIRPTAPPPAAR